MWPYLKLIMNVPGHFPSICAMYIEPVLNSGWKDLRYARRY